MKKMLLPPGDSVWLYCVEQSLLWHAQSFLLSFLTGKTPACVLS